MTPAKLAQVAAAARAPISPAAFLDQMAADAGHQHVQRLSELRVDLEAQARASHAATLQPSIERLAQALPQLDFSLLQSKGLWAAVTGKSKNAGAEFASQFEKIDPLAKALAPDAAAVQKEQQPHAAATDRTLVEFEVEYRALDKIIDQGARWLQDMRNQLKTRQAQAAADEQAQEQIRADAARCETLVARLKLLRAAVAASQQAHQQTQATAERRTALAASLQKAMGNEVKEWRSRIGTLAGAAAEGKTSGLNMEGPREAQEELAKRLDKLLAECAQLRTHEETLVRHLAAMGEQLAAAA
jgi:chromosome segregation ATPase